MWHHMCPSLSYSRVQCLSSFVISPASLISRYRSLSGVPYITPCQVTAAGYSIHGWARDHLLPRGCACVVVVSPARPVRSRHKFYRGSLPCTQRYGAHMYTFLPLDQNSIVNLLIRVVTLNLFKREITLRRLSFFRQPPQQQQPSPPTDTAHAHATRHSSILDQLYSCPWPATVSLLATTSQP